MATIRRINYSNSGIYLKKLRKTLNLDRKALAEILGIIPQTIANWELGKAPPPKNIRGGLATALNMTRMDRQEYKARLMVDAMEKINEEFKEML